MEATLQSFNQKKYAYWWVKLSTEEINCILAQYDCHYDKRQFDLNQW